MSVCLVFFCLMPVFFFFTPCFQLPGGPKHKKTGSMPDSFFQSPEVMGARDVNVKRTHSDADSAANKQRRLCGGSEGIQVRHKGMTSSDSYPLLPNSEKHRNSSDKDRVSAH